MSWQTYVDEHLMCELPHGGQLASAAIVGQDGGVWAQSDGFPEVSPEQASPLCCVSKMGRAFEFTLSWLCGDGLISVSLGCLWLSATI